MEEDKMDKEMSEMSAYQRSRCREIVEGYLEKFICKQSMYESLMDILTHGKRL